MKTQCRTGFIDMVVFLVCIAMLCPIGNAAQMQTANGTSKVRTYYIAADEVDWDYAPGGISKIMGAKFEGYSKIFTERGPHRIGTVYRKALYREYTDATFTHLKPRPPEWQHAGILGPIIRAEVGDTIRVVFKNNASRPYSMHPHGGFITKTPRELATMMERPARTKKMMPFHRERHMSTPGRCRRGQDPGPTIPARSCGCITPTLVS